MTRKPSKPAVRRVREVSKVYVLEYLAGDAWNVSVDAMAFMFKKAAQVRADKYMQNSGMEYRVSVFKRVERIGGKGAGKS